MLVAARSLNTAQLLDVAPRLRSTREAFRVGGFIEFRV